MKTLSVCTQRAGAGTWILVIFLVFSLSGCDTAVSEAARSSVPDSELLPRVAEVIDAQLPVVSGYVKEDLEEGEKGVDTSSWSGESVVEGTLGEENGHAYLVFTYDVDASASSGSDASVLDSARDVLTDEQYAELEDKVAENEKAMYAEGAEFAKSLAPSMRKAFWKDLQSLVVKSTVLFTAGIVYACIPHAVWWGKIAAASAVAVASGVVAATMLSIYRYYKYGGSKDEAFADWLASVTTEPKASYALAASIISVGSTLQRSPVLTGLIICVFALYGLVDDLVPLLRKYDFTLSL